MLLKQFPDKETYCQLSNQYNVIPVCMEILADTETPVSLLNKFHGKGPVFLLESVEGGERWGRYSFLGTSARSHIRIFSDHVEIIQNQETEKILHHGKPLSVLRNLMKSYTPAIIDDLPRFWGGMVGYLTYEMVSFFEKIPNQWPESKPMAHFIIPDEVIIFDNIQNTLKAMVITFTKDSTESPDQTYDKAFQRISSMLSIMKSPIREKKRSNSRRTSIIFHQ